MGRQTKRNMCESVGSGSEDMAILEWAVIAAVARLNFAKPPCTNNCIYMYLVPHLQNPTIGIRNKTRYA